MSKGVSFVKLIEPPCTERYARWCERSVGEIIAYLLLDQTKLHILINCCTNGALTCNHFTEEPFDLFTHTVFVKVGEKDLFIREDWL